MKEAADTADPVVFVHADGSLHVVIASISPDILLGYTGRVDLIERHTPSVLPVSEQPMGGYIAQRHASRHGLVDALEREAALRLGHERNMTRAIVDDSHASARTRDGP